MIYIGSGGIIFEVKKIIIFKITRVVSYRRGKPHSSLWQYSELFSNHWFLIIHSPPHLWFRDIFVHTLYFLMTVT